MIIVLDNIRSIYNVGSIFRTADALGVEKILLGGITPAPIDRFGLKNKALAKVALGAEQSVPWSKVASTITAIEVLKGTGHTIIALELAQKSFSLFSASLKTMSKKKIVLSLGSEVGGLSKEMLAQADLILEIPMRGKKESLNVAVAFGIVVFNLINK